MKNGGWTSRVSSSFQGIVEITNLETPTKHVTISNVTNIFFLGLFLTSMKLLRTFGVILQTFQACVTRNSGISTFHIPGRQPLPFMLKKSIHIRSFCDIFVVPQCREMTQSYQAPLLTLNKKKRTKGHKCVMPLL